MYHTNLVETHDDSLHVAALAEELMQLFLGRVVRQVTDVERRALPQQALLVCTSALKIGQGALAGWLVV